MGRRRQWCFSYNFPICLQKQFLVIAFWSQDDAVKAVFTTLSSAPLRVTDGLSKRQRQHLECSKDDSFPLQVFFKSLLRFRKARQPIRQRPMSWVTGLGRRREMWAAANFRGKSDLGEACRYCWLMICCAFSCNRNKILIWALTSEFKDFTKINIHAIFHFSCFRRPSTSLAVARM